MPFTVVLGLMFIVGGACLFLGAGIGYYSAVSAQDKKMRQLNNRMEGI